MIEIVLILFYVFFPAFVIYLCYKYPAVDKIGAVVICYLIGIALGNSGFLPEGAAKVQGTVTDLSVIIALPLLLFSMDVRSWTRHAGKAMFSMGLATLSVIIASGVAFIIVSDSIDVAWQLVGMAIGLYTGGTPNLAAIKTALNVDPSLYLTFHTYDVVAGMVYIIFCITIAQRIFLRFLPAYEPQYVTKDGMKLVATYEGEDIGSYKGILQGRVLLKLALSLLVSLGIVGISFGISQLFPKDYLTTIVILGVTSFGIALSFVPAINKIEKTFQFGMYIILIFCLAVGSMADLRVLFQYFNSTILFFVLFSIVASMMLHAVLCRIFRIDTDTFLVTSVSAICSPPFVPVVADALKNKQVVLSGLSAGIVGYAIGNYVGISMAYLFRSLAGG